MRLGDAAELGLPVAVEDDPVDVAASRIRLPAVRLRRGEVDVARRAGRVVGSSSALIGRSPTNARVIAAVIRSQAMSASSWYMSCAG